MKKERVKRLALWAIWAGLWVGLGLFGCEGFEQNPNLRLLKSRWKDGYDLLYPVWADNGKIYYLCRYSEGDTFPPDRRFLGAQAFMSISQDGVHDTLLLGDTVFWENPSPGRFFSLSYHKSTGHIAILQVEGPILIWDIWRDSVIDSVPNPKHLGPIVRWLPDGSGLLVGLDSVWRVSIGDSVYTFYGTGSGQGFEVNPDGTLYTEVYWPSFCPEDSSAWFGIIGEVQLFCIIILFSLGPLMETRT
ncbi:MAG: hypothetical protein ABIM88_05940 [candidate division WOR-3 bacterium]